MFRALTDVRPLHLADPALIDFAGLLRNSKKFSENPLQLRDAD